MWLHFNMGTRELACNFIRNTSESFFFLPLFKIVSFQLQLGSKAEMEATACVPVYHMERDKCTKNLRTGM